MGKRKSATAREGIDPDDALELTEEWFDTADYFEGDKLVLRGRPKIGFAEREALSLRLDPDVIAHYRATGPGWQSRINETLRKAANLKARG